MMNDALRHGELEASELEEVLEVGQIYLGRRGIL
jgi:hypothetical protein